jgi:hypothetical protein
VVTPAPTPTRRVTDPTLPRNSEVPVSGKAIVDGEYFGFLKSLDLDRDRLRVDFAQWLSGNRASRAAYADGYIDTPTEDVPNDYYIHNASRQLWTVPVSPRAVVTVWECPVTCAQQYEGTLEALATSLTARPHQGRAYGVYQGRLGKYWLKFRLGRVVRIDAIYTP